MEAYQWVLLGIMIALTPSLLVLAVLLARANTIEMEKHDVESER